MRGDFSAWNKDRAQNFRGSLHQQGRVLLDRDWNAQTEIMGEWQETAARDAFGAGVAAIPSDAPLGFKVVKAEILGNKASITLKKGRAWADGLLVELGPMDNNDAVRVATYLGTPSLPMNDRRDAIILETWLEELSPFQNSDLLIEPALGGVDTTERVQTAFRLRLYRMQNGDTCDSIISTLKNDFDKKDKLTVRLEKVKKTDDSCPVIEGGGYTGFEHHLYRIEIADTNAGNYFKWSQFNGGLVGTGDFDVTNHQVMVQGNRNAIINSGLNKFYLEALDFDEQLGCWKVVYGAKATLDSDNIINLPAAGAPADVLKGSATPGPPAKGKRFFRLWNGIADIASFSGSDSDLPGDPSIKIKFDGTGTYTPSDFWTFEVRAGQVGNPLNLVDHRAPQGIFYHRVPLAEVDWPASPNTQGEIEDCRQIFQPLTKLKTCCTYRVGDGVHTHGDFTKIQDAINALPREKGGEICILPGLYNEHLVIQNRYNVTLKGCGKRTVISSMEFFPAIEVTNSSNITVESLAIESRGKGVDIDSSENFALKSVGIVSRDDDGVDIKSTLNIRFKSVDINAHKSGIGIGASQNIAFESLSVKSGSQGIDIENASNISFSMLSINAGHRGINLVNSHDIKINALDVLKSAERGLNLEHIQNFTLESAAINVDGEGIVLTGDELLADHAKEGFYLKNIKMSHLTVTATGGSTVSAKYAQSFSLTDSVMYMADRESPEHESLYAAIYLTGDDMLVKGNEIRVLPYGFKGSDFAFSNDPIRFQPARIAAGGLRIGGGSQRVRIADNLIINGIGNGITLGDIEARAEIKSASDPKIIKMVDELGYVDRENFPKAQITAGLSLEDILIESNCIFNMGRSGIGVFGFISPLSKNFNKIFLTKSDSSPDTISVRGLTITENRIENCVYRNVTIPDAMLNSMGCGAIVLADTEDLVIRDNFLIGNSPNPNDPVCGIYVIQTQGLEIARNHIENVSLSSRSGTPNDRGPETGARGGIWINRATVFSQVVLSGGPIPGIMPPIRYSVKNVAAKIQENVVFVPMGRCLTLGASGAVSVTGNNFTTFNASPENPAELLPIFTRHVQLTDKIRFLLMDSSAGNVLIFEPEAFLQALNVLSGKITGDNGNSVGARVAAVRALLDRRARIFNEMDIKRDFSAGMIAGSATFSNSAAPAYPFDISYQDSNFIFASNQCHQDRLTEVDGTSTTSVLIAAQQDVGMNNNQVACKLEEAPAPNGGDDNRLRFPLINTYVYGRSCRVDDNRFLENYDGVSRETLGRFLSAFTAANWNITTDNVATHCIRVEKEFLPNHYGRKPAYVDKFNIIQIDQFQGDVTDGDHPSTLCRDVQPGVHTPNPNTLNPIYTATILENYQAAQLQEKLQYQAAKSASYRMEYERYESMYGKDDPRTMDMAMRQEMSLSEIRSSYIEYSAASAPLPVVENGWAVDGFIRTPDGEPVNGITVAGYDDKGAWLKNYGYSCTDENGYFLLTVTKLPEKPDSVFMGVSKESRKEIWSDAGITPAPGSSDRIELAIGTEFNEGGCTPPNGGKAVDVPPDNSTIKDKPKATSTKDKEAKGQEAADKKAKEQEAKNKEAKPKAAAEKEVKSKARNKKPN